MKRRRTSQEAVSQSLSLRNTRKRDDEWNISPPHLFGEVAAKEELPLPCRTLSLSILKRYGNTMTWAFTTEHKHQSRAEGRTVVIANGTACIEAHVDVGVRQKHVPELQTYSFIHMRRLG